MQQNQVHVLKQENWLANSQDTGWFTPCFQTVNFILLKQVEEAGEKVLNYCCKVLPSFVNVSSHNENCS